MENMREYEISIWRDKMKKETIDGQEVKYIGEEKIAVIGSSEIHSPLYAHDVIFDEKTNGEKSLSFVMNYLYFDEEEQKLKENPFCTYIINESKVKTRIVENGGKPKWYDFVVKNAEKSTEDYQTQYTCSALETVELGKTGYDIELDSALTNNMNDLRSLATLALEGSEWRTGDIDVPKAYVYEPVYKLRANGDFKAYDMLNPSDEITVPYGAYIYGFFSCMRNKDKEFQFLYRPDGTDFSIDSDGHINQKETNWVYKGNAQYKTNGYYSVPSFINDEAVNPYTKGEGARLQRVKYTAYDAVNDKFVNIYQDAQGKDYYGYEDVDIVTSSSVYNMFVNSQSIGLSDGTASAYAWSPSHEYDETNPPTSVMICPEYDKNANSGTMYLPYLKVEPNKWIYNSGIQSTYPMFENGFTKGQQFIARVRAGQSANGDDNRYPGAIVNTSGNVEVRLAWTTQHGAWYEPPTDENTVFSVTCTETDRKNLYDDNSGEDLDNNEHNSYHRSSYKYGVSTINDTITADELKNGRNGKILALFVKFNTNAKWAYVSYTELLRYYEKDGYFFLPNNQTLTAETQRVYTIYEIPAKDADSSQTKYILQKGKELPNGFHAKMRNDFAMVTSIDAKKSNRFNILQDLCEKFERWARFRIEHKPDGEIDTYTRHENGVYEICQAKYVDYKEYIGEKNLAGLRYGLNLQGSSRTVSSDEIVTKCYVEDNANDAADNGVCTIMTAESNPSGERFLYNFNYFIMQGLIDEFEVRRDLYSDMGLGNTSPIGLYPKLRKLNDQVKIFTDQLTQTVASLNVATSDYTVNHQAYVEAVNQLHQEESDDQANRNAVTDYDKWDTAKTYAETIAQLKSKISMYKKMSDTAEKSKNELEAKRKELTKHLENIAKEKTDYIKRFERKYIRFIQEGTFESDDYYDPELYYNEAMRVETTSATPDISYTFDVVDISTLEGYELYNYAIGDITTVEDPEFFSNKEDGTPLQVEVVVSEIERHLDNPSEDKITVQNYKTAFEDLFSRVAASVQTLEYKEGKYDTFEEFINPDRTIDYSILNDTFSQNAIDVKNAKNQSVKVDDTGITVGRTDDANRFVRLINRGLYITRDGGKTYTTGVTADGINTLLLTAGQIDTSVINIRTSKEADGIAFTWNKYGLHAFSPTRDARGLDTSMRDPYTYVRMDHYGLYSVYTPPNASLKDGAAYSTFDAIAQENEPSYASLTQAGMDKKIKGTSDSYLRFGLTDKLFFINSTTHHDLTEPNYNNNTIEQLKIYEDQPHNVFRVDNQGNAYFDGTIKSAQAEISGTVYARDGRIGGWWIYKDAIASSSGDGIMTTDPSNIPVDKQPLWQNTIYSALTYGNTVNKDSKFLDVFSKDGKEWISHNYNAATVKYGDQSTYETVTSGVDHHPFYVTMDGKLHAHNADIIGDITAERLIARAGGRLSGFNFNVHEMYWNADGVDFRLIPGLPINNASTHSGTNNDYFIKIENKNVIPVDSYFNPKTDHYDKEKIADRAYFRVTKDGMMEANNAKLDGSVTARHLVATEGGNLSGFVFDRNEMYYANSMNGIDFRLIPGNPNGGQQGTVDDYFILIRNPNLKSYIDGNTYKPTFAVTKEGKLQANDAEITGTVTAKILTATYQGNLSLFTFNSTSMSYASGGTEFYFRADTPNGTLFQVTKNGQGMKLDGNGNMYVTGTVYALAGEIGQWNLDRGILKNNYRGGSYGGYIVEVNGNNDDPVYLRSRDVIHNIERFRVNKDGTLYCSGATIEGAASISGTFSVNGALKQVARFNFTPYSFEMNGTGLKIYEAEKGGSLGTLTGSGGVATASPVTINNSTFVNRDIIPGVRGPVLSSYSGANVSIMAGDRASDLNAVNLDGRGSTVAVFSESGAILTSGDGTAALGVFNANGAGMVTLRTTYGAIQIDEANREVLLSQSIAGVTRMYQPVVTPSFSASNRHVISISYEGTPDNNNMALRFWVDRSGWFAIKQDGTIIPGTSNWYHNGTKWVTGAQADFLNVPTRKMYYES